MVSVMEMTTAPLKVNVTVEERVAETMGEMKPITAPLNMTVEFTSTPSMKTLAETKPYAVGITKEEVCAPPSTDTALGDMDRSCGRLSGKIVKLVGMSRV